jgi:hypothetical protein
MIIEAQQLLTPFASLPQLPRNFCISDANYFCPTQTTVDNIIVPAYKWWMRSLKWTNWTHKWDCDNFADAFKLFACGWHANNTQDEAEGMAIGVINYMANQKAEDGLKGGHAINIIYTDAGKNDQGEDAVQPLFFEPQTGGYYNLTAEEFQSIWTVYL